MQRKSTTLTPGLIARFWQYVDKTTNPNGCWLWTASKNQWGYGRMSAAAPEKGMRQSHRVSYLIHFGDIPDNLSVLHRCDNPPCVNPEHLWLGSTADNIHDMYNKGRQAPIPRPYGDLHWTHLHPEVCARGEKNGTHTRPETVHRGEKNGRAKLTETDVRYIRSEVAHGRSYQSLADQFDMGKSSVARIVHKTQWIYVR